MMPLHTGAVLVVEDSDEDFATVVEALEMSGCPNEIRRTATGDDCLRMLHGLDETPLRPSLVLLDLNTPGRDGRDLLRAIKTDPGLKTLPVVVFTTSSSPHDVASCYREGANAYHTKPFDYMEHLHRLRDVLKYWLGSVYLPSDRRWEK